MAWVIENIVDNQKFLLALDYLYREHMQKFEITHLLPAATELVEQLKSRIKPVPIEGYYNESEELSDYFLKMRALQATSISQKSLVENTEAYQLLASVMSSKIYGYKLIDENFFPQRFDAFTSALAETPVTEWSIPSLTNKAYKIALKENDCSLTGLAASIQDALVLTAFRESTALYAYHLIGGVSDELPTYEYKWQVDPELASKANQFIDAFNKLTHNTLKPAQSEHAEYFYNAYISNHSTLKMRCIRIGSNDSVEPMQHYHWVIDYTDGQYSVKDIWSSTIWTTDDYIHHKYFSARKSTKAIKD